MMGLSDPQWVPAMVRLLAHLHAEPFRRIDLGLRGKKLARVGRRRWNDMGYHRWHDSGDLQSVEHLRKIIEVCRPASWRSTLTSEALTGGDHIDAHRDAAQAGAKRSLMVHHRTEERDDG